MRHDIQIYPGKVKSQEVEDKEHLEERVSAINCLFANLVGVSDGYLELCSEQEEPSKEELLAWSWLIKPSQGEAVTKEGSDELCLLITQYQHENMEQWWKDMTSEPSE